jgi:hypothetical protein
VGLFAICFLDDALPLGGGDVVRASADGSIPPAVLTWLTGEEE